MRVQCGDPCAKSPPRHLAHHVPPGRALSLALVSCLLDGHVGQDSSADRDWASDLE